jgi:hypothetical protein
MHQLLDKRSPLGTRALSTRAHVCIWSTDLFCAAHWCAHCRTFLPRHQLGHDRRGFVASNSVGCCCHWRMPDRVHRRTYACLLILSFVGEHLRVCWGNISNCSLHTHVLFLCAEAQLARPLRVLPSPAVTPATPCMRRPVLPASRASPSTAPV